MSYRRPVLAAAALATGAGAAVACLAPTELDVRLTTDIDCATVARFGVSIYGADPKAGPISTSRACDSGDLGNLIVAPSGARDAAIALSVVVGVTRDSESCAAANYAGCIVARRQIRFSKHDRLALPIALNRSCLDVPCTEKESCAAGRCAPADVEDPRFCSGADCPWASGGSCATPLCSFVRVRQGAQAFGVAASATTLYWAEDTGVFSLPLSAVENADVRPSVVPYAAGSGPFVKPRGVATGIVSGQWFYAATTTQQGGDLSCAWAHHEGADDSAATMCSNPIYGLAILDQPSVPTASSNVVPQLAGTSPEVGVVTPTFSGATRPEYVRRPEYLESRDGGVFVARQEGLSFFTPAGPGNPAPLEDAGATPGENLIGVAVGDRRIYVSTASGKLLALDRTTRAAVPFPGGAPTLPGPQDLAFVPRAGGGDLYVVATGGLYLMRGVE